MPAREPHPEADRGVAAHRCPPARAKQRRAHQPARQQQGLVHLRGAAYIDELMSSPG
eukprot:COSAG01_NODE_1900_length_8964_cov_121.219177_7_plen_57_part_00